MCLKRRRNPAVVAAPGAHRRATHDEHILALSTQGESLLLRAPESRPEGRARVWLVEHARDSYLPAVAGAHANWDVHWADVRLPRGSELYAQ